MPSGKIRDNMIYPLSAGNLASTPFYSDILISSSILLSVIFDIFISLVTEWSFHYCPVSSAEHSPKFQFSKAVPFRERYGVFSSRRSTGNMIYPYKFEKFLLSSIIIVACPPKQYPKFQSRKAAPILENNGHE